jgi:hypothetical protein
MKQCSNVSGKISLFSVGTRDAEGSNSLYYTYFEGQNKKRKPEFQPLLQS